MAGTPISEQLARLPHFRMVEPAVRERIAAGCRLVRFEAGQRVLSQGEPCRAFFLVRSGAVRLFRLSPDGREQIMHQLREGQTFAEAAVLTFETYPVSGVALETPTELLEIRAEPFLELFRSDPRVAAAMVASLSEWLHRLVERIEELTVASAGARLAHHLLRLPARTDGDALRIDLPLPKRDLAAHLSITPETLSRLLRRWKDRGIVESRGRALRVLDASVLEAIAEGGEPR